LKSTLLQLSHSCILSSYPFWLQNFSSDFVMHPAKRVVFKFLKSITYISLSLSILRNKIEEKIEFNFLTTVTLSYLGVSKFLISNFSSVLLHKLLRLSEINVKKIWKPTPLFGCITKSKEKFEIKKCKNLRYGTRLRKLLHIPLDDFFD
jgi:hypothetical protein